MITVQTDGALNFDQPAPVCFPNLPDPVLGVPLPAGSKQALISFNHDKGIWEAVGSMTVSADGKLVCTDPGVGILQPGWHGVAPRSTGPCPNCVCRADSGGPQPASYSTQELVEIGLSSLHRTPPSPPPKRCPLPPPCHKNDRAVKECTDKCKKQKKACDDNADKDWLKRRKACLKHKDYRRKNCLRQRECLEAIQRAEGL